MQIIKEKRFNPNTSRLKISFNNPQILPITNPLLREKYILKNIAKIKSISGLIPEKLMACKIVSCIIKPLNIKIAIIKLIKIVYFLK